MILFNLPDFFNDEYLYSDCDLFATLLINKLNDGEKYVIVTTNNIIKHIIIKYRNKFIDIIGIYNCEYDIINRYNNFLRNNIIYKEQLYKDCLIRRMTNKELNENIDALINYPYSIRQIEKTEYVINLIYKSLKEYF
jgi:hypothetical protein